MTTKSWLRFLLAGAAVVTLAGCSKADRAVMFAPPCPEGPAARPTQRELPTGAVWAWKTPYGAQEGTFREGPIPGLTEVVSLADSGHTTVAVRADGTVWSWGTNVSGSLGHGSAERIYEARPRQVTGVGDAHAVYNSGTTFYVVLRDGTVMAWGSDRFLVKGGKREGYEGVTVPERVSGVGNVAVMGPGDLNAFALRADGRVTGWGINLTDVLGDRNDTRIGTIPDVEGVVDVSSAGEAVVAVKADGKVCAWGSNAHGLLGVEPTGGQTANPVRVGGLRNIVQVAGGANVAYAVDRDGRVWAWGRGAGGALGDGDIADHVRAKPIRVTGLPKIRRVSAFGLMGHAIDTKGRLWAWGSGAPAAETPGRPVRIPLPAPALDVSGHHVLVRPN